MLQKEFLGFAGAAEDSSDLSFDSRCSTLIGRTMLQASAMLPLLSCETAHRALEGEVEQMAVTDFAAAERALKSLQVARALLSRALSDIRMADEVSCVIVSAAESAHGRD
jgi:hypothetical protein